MDNKLNVSSVWEDAAKKYEKKRNSKYKKILQDKNSKKFYKEIENKYETIYRERLDKFAAVITQKESEQIGKLIYVKERKYLVSKLAEENGRCLICGNLIYRNSAECDHILCKSKFPELSFIPLNLAVICHECNKAKKEKVSRGIFNPYLDNFDKEKLA